MALFTLALGKLEQVLPPRPIPCACVQECVSVDKVPQILGHPLEGQVENDQL